MKPLIFISGPYTAGLQSAALAAEEVVKAGAWPLVPHFAMAWSLMAPHDNAFYHSHALELLAHCDGLLRLPGVSLSADLEVEEALRLELPVVWVGEATVAEAVVALLRPEEARA